MEQRPFPPPHSLVQGYPFAGIDSGRFLDPHRNSLMLDKENIIAFDVNVYGTDEKEALKKVLHIYKKALEIAELQIADILEERPFIPESFGFEEIGYGEEKPAALKQPFYVSKYSERYILHRVPNSHLWKLKIFPDVEDCYAHNAIELDLDLPCARIAFALFYSLNIQMTEIELLEALEVAPTENNEEITN